MYRCTVCGKADGILAIRPTLDPSLGHKYCFVCRRETLFRAVDSGDAAKAAGMAAVEQSAGQGVDAAWQQEAEQAARQLAASGVEFTAETLCERVGRPVSHPNAVGALVSRLARQGVIEAVRFEASTRTERHGNPNRVWRGRRAA